MFEDIGEPISDNVKIITGRTDEDIRGKRFDTGYINTLCETHGIFVAHHAAYDRPKLEKRFPRLERSAWGCSPKDIAWIHHHIVDKKLRLLALDLGGFHFQGHHAEDDCLALLEVLATPLPATERTIFQHLLSHARTPTTRLYTIDAPFVKKETLKSAGFTWQNDAPKS
jgi:DNA polymerase-3 subunit epsilon